MSIEIDFEALSNGSINNIDPQNVFWDGDGILDKMLKVINLNIKIQYDDGRLKGTEYAEVYLGAMQTALSESIKFLLNKDLIEKQIEGMDVKNAIDEVQLAENSEKWAIQKQVLENQLEMSNVDVAYKEQSLLKDLEIRDKQIESANADVAFNESKKLIMEQTRKDNIRSKAAEQFAEFMKYISAANVVPGPTDFANMRALITAMNTGIANPDAIATIISGGADYVKP
jgi:hypothetical protein